MSAPASIPFFGDAYLADTQHLNLEEHGAYFKLLLCAWRTASCELPADDKRIATMLGITAGRWSKLRPAVLAFWTRTETGWKQKRLSKEREFVAEKISKNILAAEARWSGKPLKSKQPADANGIAGAMPLSPPPPEEKEESLSAQAPAKPEQETKKDPAKFDPDKLVDASEKVTGYPMAFESWWSAYPRKAGKGEAKTAWKKARWKLGANAEAEAKLLAVAERYAAEVAASGDAIRYCPHPATWLNQARYDDPPQTGDQADGQPSRREFRGRGKHDSPVTEYLDPLAAAANADMGGSG